MFSEKNQAYADSCLDQFRLSTGALIKLTNFNFIKICKHIFIVPYVMRGNYVFPLPMLPTIKLLAIISNILLPLSLQLFMSFGLLEIFSKHIATL